MNLETINLNDRVAYSAQSGMNIAKSNIHLVKSSKNIKDTDSSAIFGIELKLLTRILLIFSIVIIIALITSISYNIKLNSYLDEMTHIKKNPDQLPEISISDVFFGRLADGNFVKKYILKNKNGFEVVLISFGATIQSIKVKDRNGRNVNVALGLSTIEEYANRSINPYFGSIIGRTTNRITNGEFFLNGVKYNLEKNDGRNNLHGGLSGFDMKNWHAQKDKDSVIFHYNSPENEGGYPGNVNVEVIYRLESNRNLLSIEYKATTNKDTPIDLTNHAYFNLNGHSSGIEIYNHELQIFSDTYLDFNPTDLLVSGEIKSVTNTKYDFRNFTRIGDRMERKSFPEAGFDNYFITNQQSGKKHVASVKNPLNGIKIDIFSDQNGVQFYSSNFLNVTTPTVSYGLHNAFCLETHNYPDAVNKFKFPSSIIKPAGEYIQKTSWLFTTF